MHDISNDVVPALQIINTWRDWDSLTFDGDGVLGVSFAPPSKGPDAISAKNTGPGRAKILAKKELQASTASSNDPLAASWATLRRRPGAP